MPRAGSLIVAAAVALVACRTRPLEQVDDSGATSCPVRAVVPVPLSGLNVSDLNVWNGAYARAVFRVNRYICMPPAPPRFSYDAATQTLTITARAFAAPAGLPPYQCTQFIEEKYTLDLSTIVPLSPGTLNLRDGAPDSIGLLYQHPVQPPPTTSCAPPADGTCQLDCQCRDPSAPRCWPDARTCVRGCITDGDCPAVAPMCEDGLCVASGPGCRSRVCSYGSDCTELDGAYVCRPANTGFTRGRCTKDSDCGWRGICSGCACVLPCEDDSDCPNAMRCDEERGCVYR